MDKLAPASNKFKGNPEHQRSLINQDCAARMTDYKSIQVIKTTKLTTLSFIGWKIAKIKTSGMIKFLDSVTVFL